MKYAGDTVICGLDITWRQGARSPNFVRFNSCSFIELYVSSVCLRVGMYSLLVQFRNTLTQTYCDRLVKKEMLSRSAGSYFCNRGRLPCVPKGLYFVSTINYSYETQCSVCCSRRARHSKSHVLCTIDKCIGQERVSVAL